MQDKVEVMQEDREAAARWAKSNSRHAQAANMRRGSCDTAPLVQAFARHREQATASLRTSLQATAEAAAAHCRTAASLREERDALRAAIDDGLGQIAWINAQAESAMALCDNLIAADSEALAVSRMMLDSTASDIGINAMILSDKLSAALSSALGEG